MENNVLWAFVVDADPLRVLFPGDSEGVEINYKSDGVLVAAGDRVWLLQVAAHQWVIGGKIVAV